MSETTDSICGFPAYKPYCLECKAPLLIENAWMSDGCPCNSKPGCNTINGTRWRLLRDLQQQQSDELATLRAQVAQLTAERDRANVLIRQLQLIEDGLSEQVAARLDPEETKSALRQALSGCGPMAIVYAEACINAMAGIKSPKEEPATPGDQ